MSDNGSPTSTNAGSGRLVHFGFEADLGHGSATASVPVPSAEASLEFEFLQPSAETVSASGDQTELKKSTEEESNIMKGASDIRQGDCGADKDEDKHDAAEEQKDEEEPDDVIKDEEKTEVSEVTVSAVHVQARKDEDEPDAVEQKVNPEAKETEESTRDEKATSDGTSSGHPEDVEKADKSDSQVSQDPVEQTEVEPDQHAPPTEGAASDCSQETNYREDKSQAISEVNSAENADGKSEDQHTQRPSSHRTASESSEASSSRSSRAGFRLLGIEFAPVNTPMRRRLQTFAVAQWLLSITILPVLCVLLMFFLLFTPLAPLVLAYIGWILLFDRKTSQRGGRRWDWVRRWSLWRHYRDYFPISLVKSAELDPAHNYLIGYHPHGIISCGAFCNFGTEATGFSAKFPGIKPHLLTLRMNFFWPLLRGYNLAAGICDVSRPSIQWILGREGGGNAAIIVIGGAQEALDARPGNYRLTLLRRKGFARMALQTGAHLVPCFSFGENDLFKQAANPPGSKVRAFQQHFKGAMGSSPPLFYGRGVFNYSFGMMPFRHEVITVVGAPIPVVKCPEPSQEQVDALHGKYMAKLSDLFDSHKARYGVTEDVKLEFV